MPKHQGPVQQLIDPFSIPAQMNNLGVFIVAYVTMELYGNNECTDPDNLNYLHFIYYGSMIVCGGTALLSVLYMLGILDYLINKVIPCGEVCLTLNTLTIFISGLLYHFIATIYGLYELIWGESSVCIELEMFKKITCWIYLCWFVFIVGYAVIKGLWLNRKKEVRSV
jgi:hypothetical protein